MLKLKLQNLLKSSGGKCLTYYNLHLAYFITTACIGTLILWSLGSKQQQQEHPKKHFALIDCLYMIVSGLCLSGLSSVPIEDISVGGQVTVMLMMILGGQILGSLVPLLVKKHRYCRIARTVLTPQSEAVAAPSIVTTLFNFVKSLFRMSQDDIWMESMAPKRQLLEPFRAVFLEHQAVSFLADIVAWYLLAVQFVGFLIAWICILTDHSSKRVLHGKGVNSGFFSLFAVISGFTNTGFVLSNENMVPLNSSSLLLLDLSVVVLLGNTLFPPALRLILWLRHRSSQGTRKEVYELLLDHPQKYYKHLFPHKITLWLLIPVIGLNGLGCLLFLILDSNNGSVKGLNAAQKFINSLFQVVNSRGGGMNSVNLSGLSAALLFLYCIMMYLEPYPVHLKEEQEKEQDTSVLTQSRRALAKDSTYLAILVLLICICLNNQLRHDPRNFNVFNILFEVASAYGCVGLSMGYSCDLRIEPGVCKDIPISFSGKWGALGKVLIIIVMMLGRHRGLSSCIDSPTDNEKLTMLLRRPSFIALTQQPASDPL